MNYKSLARNRILIAFFGFVFCFAFFAWVFCAGYEPAGALDINFDTSYSEEHTVSEDIFVKSGAALTVTGQLSMPAANKIVVEPGGTVTISSTMETFRGDIVVSGVLNVTDSIWDMVNTKITVNEGGTVNITNARLPRAEADSQEFNAPIILNGGTLNLNYNCNIFASRSYAIVAYGGKINITDATHLIRRVNEEGNDSFKKVVYLAGGAEFNLLGTSYIFGEASYLTGRIMDGAKQMCELYKITSESPQAEFDAIAFSDGSSLRFTPPSVSLSVENNDGLGGTDGVKIYNKQPMTATAVISNGGGSVFSYKWYKIDNGNETELPFATQSISIINAAESGRYKCAIFEGSSKIAESEAVNLTINPLAAELAWSGSEFVYNGKHQAPSASVNNLIDGDVCEVTVRGSGKDADKYTAEAISLSNPNYILSGDVTVPFTVFPKIAQIEWQNIVFTYDGGEHIPDAVVANLEEGDSCAVTVEGKARNADTHTAKATGLDNPNYFLPEGTQTEFTVLPLTAIIVWGDTELTYNGSPQAPCAVVANPADGDTCEVTVSGAAVYVGGYTATATGLSNSNYALPGDTQIPFSIVPINARIEWQNTELVYNGQAQKPRAVVANLIGDDTCEAEVVGEGINAGDYFAEAVGLTNENYALRSDAIIDFKILPVTAEIIWGDTTLIYNGYAQKPSAGVANLVGNDTCTVTVGGEGINAGEYTAIIIALSNENYSVPAENEKEYSILPLTAQIEWQNTLLTYNGLAQKPVAAVANLTANDACEIEVEGEGTNAGSYTARAAGLSNANYALPGNDTVEFTILPFVIEIEWQNILLTYNGEVQKPAAIAVNLIGGDACGLTVGGGAKDAGTYTARVIGIDNGNYALPANVTVVYTIQPLTACLEWDNLAFTYNGSLQKPSARVANLLEGDTCEVTVSGAAVYVGGYTATAAGLSNSNYALPEEGCRVAFVINKAVIGIEYSGYVGLMYDGSEHKVSATATGVFEGDEVNLLLEGHIAVYAGNYTLRVVGTDNDNYSLPANGLTLNYSVGKPFITIVIDDKESVYGDPLLPLTYTAYGYEGGFDLGIALTKEKGLAPGKYTISAVYAQNPNFMLAVVDGEYTITKRTAHISFSGYGEGGSPREYNHSTFNIYISLQNIVYGDDVKYFPLTLEFEKDGEIAFIVEAYSYHIVVEDFAGEYRLRINDLMGADADKYDFEGAEITYTVLPRTLTVEFEGSTNLVYNGQPHNIRATARNLVVGDEVTLFYEGSGYINAGTYTVTVTGTDNPNYSLPENVSRIYMINKATPSVSVEAREFYFPYDTSRNYSVEATSSNGLPVRFYRIDGESLVPIMNSFGGEAGIFNIILTTDENPNYFPATPVEITVIILRTRLSDGENAAFRLSSGINPDAMFGGGYVPDAVEAASRMPVRRDKQVAYLYRPIVIEGGHVVSVSGRVTVTLKLPENYASGGIAELLCYENGAYVYKTAAVEGGYITFEMESIGEIALLSDRDLTPKGRSYYDKPLLMIMSFIAAAAVTLSAVLILRAIAKRSAKK
jgi:hypothetical protein